MSEMVERVARAIGQIYDGYADPDETPENWKRATSAARAAIEAMKMPTEQQLAAAWDVITAEKQGQGITRLTPGLGAREIYRAMIQAALGDG